MKSTTLKRGKMEALTLLNPVSYDAIFDLLTEKQYTIGRDWSHNTVQAYAKDIVYYLKYIHEDGLEEEEKSLYDRNGDFLKHLSESYAYASFQRKIVALRSYFELKGMGNHFTKEQVKGYLSYVKRNSCIHQKQAKVFSMDHLRMVIDGLQDDSLQSCRNKALLLTGFTCALRRSELLNLRRNDISFTDDGILLSIRISKTNQYGKEDIRFLPLSENRGYCPVRALEKLLTTLPQKVNGYLFYGVNQNNTYKLKPLSASGLQKIFKKLLGNEFSTHSLRKSFVTNGRKRGASNSELMQQTKHKTEAMIRLYTQIHDVREHNAVNKLLL